MNSRIKSAPDSAGRSRGVPSSATFVILAWLCWLAFAALGLFEWINRDILYDQGVAPVVIAATLLLGLAAGAILYGVSNCLLLLAEIRQSVWTPASPEAAEPPDSGS